MANIYTDDINKVLVALNSSTNGLNEAAVRQSQARHGLNELKRGHKRSFVKIFLEQFKNLLVMMLLAATIISFAMGSYRDGSILLLVVLFNALVGLYQDWKSENILASLQNIVIEKCFVVREGILRELPATQLVPGDIVKLNEGDGIPADLRLIETTSFACNEFFLTGESIPADKDATYLTLSKALTERHNCAFMGSTVARGEAIGVVYATGSQTEIGKIASQSSQIEASLTPLQQELDQVAKKITIFTAVLTLILFAIELYFGQNLIAALTFAIGVAAAMVPEGLPAQITISLALGVRRLAQKKAVVKKLSAVEALGAATVIASDKTGTITQNEMTIIHLHLDGHDYQITGTGYQPQGEVLGKNDAPIDPDHKTLLKLPLLAGYLASTSKVAPPDAFHSDWYPIGDPTECAFSTLALKSGFGLEDIDSQFPKIGHLPFDSTRKMVTLLRRSPEGIMSFTKGSIEEILKACPHQLLDGQATTLSAQEKTVLLDGAAYHASQGKRIIALAYKKHEDIPKAIDHRLESDLTFIGFATMIDPPRANAAFAIQKAYEAGIKVVMITGDNEITAQAIAKHIGMALENGDTPPTVNSSQLSSMTDEQIKTILQKRSVIFSRVSPEQKYMLVSLLKQAGEVVAVTGDGVNDTLSLKKSDIGVAMGDKGSKVAQEAASMVLLDDNFATIVDAIAEGRTIYSNLKKNVFANLIGNIAELTCILVGFFWAFSGLPMTLLAVHILLIDLLANMLPLLMLTFDPPSTATMSLPPRKKGEMLNLYSLGNIVFNGLLKGLVSCLAFWLSYGAHEGDPQRHQIAMTATMLSLILCQFANIISLRTPNFLLEKYLFSNKLLFAGMGSSLLLLSAVVYLPYLNDYLHTAPLALIDWKYIAIGTLAYLTLLECKKLLTPKHP